MTPWIKILAYRIFTRKARIRLTGSFGGFDTRRFTVEATISNCAAFPLSPEHPLVTTSKLSRGVRHYNELEDDELTDEIDYSPVRYTGGRGMVRISVTGADLDDPNVAVFLSVFFDHLAAIRVGMAEDTSLESPSSDGRLGYKEELRTSWTVVDNLRYMLAADAARTEGLTVGTPPAT